MAPLAARASWGWLQGLALGLELSRRHKTPPCTSRLALAALVSSWAAQQHCRALRRRPSQQPSLTTQAGSFLVGEPENVRHHGSVPGAEPGERPRRRAAPAVYCSAVPRHRALMPDIYSDVGAQPTCRREAT